MNKMSDTYLADFGQVKQALENTAEAMNCRVSSVSSGLSRKLGHAEQILQGSKNSKRHQNWKQNGGIYTRE